MSFLGNEKKKVVRLECVVCREGDSPEFKLILNEPTTREYRELMASIRNADATEEDERDYLKAVVHGFSGLTVRNFTHLWGSGKLRYPETTDVDVFEIEYSPELVFELYKNCWPGSFADVLFQCLNESYSEHEEEEEELRTKIQDYVHATYRSKAPSSCEDCELKMEGAEECFFHKHWGVPECPYMVLHSDPKMAQFMSFATKAIDSWEVDADPVKQTSPRPGQVKVTDRSKKKQYGISVEKFDWACRLHQVEGADQLEALTWVGIVVKAANEAPELEILKMREERKAELRKRF